MREKILPIKAFAAVGVSVAFFLAACGDTVNEYNNSAAEVVASVDDLPKCTEDNDGEHAYVKGEPSERLCVDGEWLSMSSGETPAADFSCKTEELKDKSGLKIVCNGDSIGVVLNGSNGEAKSDTVEADSEKIAISLDSLVGYTQKGPFLKGSTVYLYELSDGRTLKQTNGNFTSVITRDDGRYKFTARDLASQYAMIVVEGYYRNEVTGKPSNASIRLRAITDMRKRSDANINLLTHLEFDRVYHLVTRGDSTGKKLTVKQAKREAQREILREFYIELGENTDAEDMDVFGDSEADAALLAISILLQGDRNETNMMVLLTEIANDMAEDGKWDGETADSLKATIADWAVYADGQGRLRDFRKHVKEWHLSENEPPAFEKFVRNFVNIETKLGKCGDKTIPVGTVKKIDDTRSKYYAKDYEDTTKTKERFICADADSAWWRLATDLEKDRFEWSLENTKDGTLLTGPISGRMVVWDADTIRLADSIEYTGGKGCTSYNQKKYFVLNGQYSYYKCGENGWEFTLDTLNMGSFKDPRDEQIYKTVGIKTQMWMAENLNYEYKEGIWGISYSYCYNDTASYCTKYGRLYEWTSALSSCPEGWHLPSTDDFETLITAVGGEGPAGTALKSKSGWDSNSSYGNGNDSFGFSALPAGGYLDNDYKNMGSYAYFWTEASFFTVDNEITATVLRMSGTSTTVNLDEMGIYAELSVRCLKD